MFFKDLKDFDLYEAIEFIELLFQIDMTLMFIIYHLDHCGPIFDDEISRFIYALDKHELGITRNFFVVAVEMMEKHLHLITGYRLQQI
ncbi:hypothetical protein P7H06_25600 [Paenibacillus larvae]|nr:hypothetical protein [Paenibacillus larvae]MDT2262192.1 hypothetical protein [Paenibacillus larvae]